MILSDTRDPGAVPSSHQVFDNNGNYRLRSHTIEEFINFSEFVDMFHYRLLDSDEKKTENLFSEKENPVFDYLVEEFGESSQFLVKRNLLNDIMELYKNQEVEYSCHLSKEVDELKANMIKRLSYSLYRLFLVVGQDQGLANLIEDCVALRLLKILENLDLLDIQYFAAGILSRASFDECGWVMKKAVPVLLKLICSQRCNLLAVEATVTLMRLANKAPHVINVSLLRDLSALVKASKSHGLLVHLAMFLAFVCRRPDLSIDEKKNVLLPILGELLGKDFKPPHGCRKDFKPPHGYKVLACYSLSYLTYDSYETCAAVRVQICERLVELTSHKSSSVVGSALGVIGNIVRWGNSEQIENFAKGRMFLQWLDKNVLCSEMKKIQVQGCQIISNIAARRETLIEVMVKAGLVDPICTLLEGDEPDVKMEAAWAILYMFYDKY
ncbi:hypothetical protein POM88_004949 [Heracleum sosnowskyi]|uniref:Uncharacterized protein n=1 Tax=Heracleum sosnowskyi TaxID=360622 RepID=A0AAD8JKX4_9APIA|nr:hypothetical protein POM88_004949 [Heracleum sosnowskyi]